MAIARWSRESASGITFKPASYGRTYFSHCIQAANLTFLNPGVVSVTPNGLVTALGSGSTNVKAHYYLKNGRARIMQQKARPASSPKNQDARTQTPMVMGGRAGHVRTPCYHPLSLLENHWYRSCFWLLKLAMTRRLMPFCHCTFSFVTSGLLSSYVSTTLGGSSLRAL